MTDPPERNQWGQPIIPDGYAMTPQERRAKLGIKRGLGKPGAKGYYAEPGGGPKGEFCRTCINAKPVSAGNRRVYKCALMRGNWTHGLATDILLRSPACSGWVRKGT